MCRLVTLTLAGKITDASMARYGPVAGKYIKKEYAASV